MAQYGRSTIVRRSTLLVSLADERAVLDCWRHNADAVALDLGALPVDDKPAARKRVRDTVDVARKGGAEVSCASTRAAGMPRSRRL
jgi:hypothetical protein